MFKEKYDTRPLFLSGQERSTANPFDRTGLGPDHELTSAVRSNCESNPKFDEQLDSIVSGTMNQHFSTILKECIPNGLVSKFPENFFSLMVMAGAKGSEVNHA
jgi:DNA-directed RNA polymerase I subunit RPA1